MIKKLINHGKFVQENKEIFVHNLLVGDDLQRGRFGD